MFTARAGLVGAPPAIAESDAVRVGLPVVAVGFSGGQFGVAPGSVQGLFNCICDGGRVIKTSAPFEPGASGGGLFDRQGNLLGASPSSRPAAAISISRSPSAG